MKLSMQSIVTYMIVIICSGCAAQQLKVTYHSEPPGATIYSSGSRMGIAPCTLYYDMSPEDLGSGEVRLSPITAYWVSGASKSTGTITANLRAYGFNQQLTIFRPSDAPGAAIDAGYQVQREYNRLIERQTEVREREEESKAAMDALNAINALRNQMNQMK